MDQSVLLEAEEAGIVPVVEPLRDGLRAVFTHVLLLAALAAGAVWHGWLPHRVLAPSDNLKLAAPWATPGVDAVPGNEQLMDQTTQFVPWTLYAVDRYRAGQIPLWNPYAGLGEPFLANGQSAIFFPTILLHWHLPPTWSWVISAMLRLMVAGIGVYVLAGRYRLRGAARVLASACFMLCGFNVVWLNHPQMNVMPFLPWGVWLTHRLCERVTLGRFLAAAGVLALALLGGHPASCIHLLLACGLVYLFEVGRGWGWVWGGLAMVGAGVFAFVLAAAQWLPLLAYAHESGATIVRAAKLAQGPKFALDARFLIGLVFPYANGFPDGVAPFELRQVTHLPNTNELAAGFSGVVALLLAGFAVARQRRLAVVKLWVGVGLICVLIAIRFPGVDWVVGKVPGLNVSQNARLLVVLALGVSILAGFGLQELGEIGPRARRWIGVGAIGLAALAVVSAWGLWGLKSMVILRGEAKATAMYDVSSEHEHSLAQVKAVVGRVHKELVLTAARLLIPAGVLGAVWVILGRKKSAGWWMVGVGAAEMLAFAAPFNPGAEVGSYFLVNVPAVSRLHELMAARPGRFAATFRTLIPETGMAYGLADLRSYDALAPARLYRWWAHPKIGNLPESMQGYLSRLDDAEHPAWSLMNFGYLVTGPDQPAPDAQRFTKVESGDDAAIYQATTFRPRAWVVPRAEALATEAEVLDRVAVMDFDPDAVVLLDREVWPGPDEAVWGQQAGAGFSRSARVEILGAAKNEEARPEVVRLRTSGAGGGWLVVADAYTSGWTAFVVDDRGVGHEAPILPAYGAMRAIPLPEGVSATVEMRYRPWSWRIGAACSMGGAAVYSLLAGGMMFRSWRRAG